MREWVCLNGELMPAEQAQVSVFDSGFMQGIGLFETMRTYHGEVFRLERHLDRLVNSARALHWAAPLEVEQLRNDVERVVQATEQETARVRVTVTTGSLRAGASDEPQLTVVATAAPGGAYPDEYYQKGVTVGVSAARQNPSDPTCGHKTTSYFARLAALRDAHLSGQFEALWLTPDDAIAEGSISSLFVVAKHRLITPPLDTPILPGITRATVIELADALGVEYAEQRLTVEALLEADEAFLTSSLMGVMPIARVGRHAIGTGKPGDLTARLYDAYQSVVDEECAHA